MLLEEVTSTPMRHSVSYPRNYHHSPPVNWQKRFDSQMQDEATSSEDETTNQTRSREGSPETFLNSITRGFQTSKGLLPSLRTHYGEIPQDRPLKEQFNLDGQPQGPCSDPSRMHASLYVIERYYGPCVEAIDSLRAMTISGLRLGTHHKGRKLLAKVVGTSMIVNGIQTIIEDRKGDVVTLVICHPPKDIEPEDLLPLNALIIIKQPMFEVWPNGDGGLRYDIRVDHLSDLIIKMNPQYDSQLNTLDSLEWKERGDLDMEHQDKWSAVAW